MVEVEIDGKKVSVPPGSMVMDAAVALKIYVPHFCYHKRLSIAASCRMCLVEVEKAPKPLPACATPVSQGMIVRTQSALAKQAQQSVMEFLLINHPLDCPICDQGGECQLQDLAVGYGASGARFTEPKRVVFHKSVGPLISAEEMTRCIHCTRCVRFGQELGGIMELGMGNRGKHSEILSFVGRSVDSELSGNMIDLCPVGALTSKPFRYTARAWELARRKSISPHDSLGSNLVVQVKSGRVLRVVPLENEAVNDMWLSDRDRFAYEGLNAADRLTRPLLKQDGQWREVDWAEALRFAADALLAIEEKYGAESIGALASVGSTAEELYLLAKLVRTLGGDNIDFRVRQSDFTADGKRGGAPWLGLPVAELERLDRVLLIGSFLRKDHPLLALRLRMAAKRGCAINVLHGTDDDLLMRVANKAIVAPSAWVQTLAQVAVAVARLKGVTAPPGGVEPDERAQAIADSLCSGEAVAVLLGNAAVQSPQAAQISAWAQWIASATGARLGALGEGANSVGGYLAGAVPRDGGMNARQMIEQPRRAYLLWNLEPELDTADSAATMQALAAADTVIAFSAYRGNLTECADLILPIAPFTETFGTFVNCEGRAQSFQGSVAPLGESRPGWKVLRVLGNQMGLAGFNYDTPESVRAEAIPEDLSSRLSNAIDIDPQAPVGNLAAERISEVPIYATDAIVRRATSLQQTVDAATPKASANAKTLAGFGVVAGAQVRVRQGDATVLLECGVDERLPDGVVRVPAGYPATAGLGPMFGPIALEPI